MVPYSVTLVSAVGIDEVFANQLVEGGVDAVVFENFIRALLQYIRSTERYMRKRVVLLMDNATIHRHQSVLATCLEMKAVVLFNPPYSPHLNPVEVFFKRLKAHIRRVWPTSR